MKYFNFLLAIVAICVSTGNANANNCIANAFSSSPEANWRSSATNASQSQSFSPTSEKREKTIKSKTKKMEKETLDDGVAAQMALINAEGMKQKVVFLSGGYGTHEVTKIQFSKLGPAGIFKGTLLLSVSGHTGEVNARKWATTDTYSILAESNYLNTPIIKDAKSLGIVTLQEVEIPMKAGETIRILYDRSGSAGPHGYIEERALDLVWDGT